MYVAAAAATYINVFMRFFLNSYFWINNLFVYEMRLNAFDRNFIFAQNCNRHYQLSAYLHGRALQVYVAPHHLWHIDLTQTLNHKQYDCISRLTYIQSQINWSTMFMWFWDQLTLAIRKKKLQIPNMHWSWECYKQFTTKSKYILNAREKKHY